MNVTGYTTVFDYSRDGWRDLYGLMIALILTAIMYVYCRYRFYPLANIARSVRLRSQFYFAPMIFPLFLLVVEGWYEARIYIELRHAFAAGNVGVVEGPIEGYQPWVPHASGESFVVSGVVFSMWDSYSQAFDDMPIQLHDGDRVRITYVGNVIVKFQLASH